MNSQIPFWVIIRLSGVGWGERNWESYKVRGIIVLYKVYWKHASGSEELSWLDSNNPNSNLFIFTIEDDTKGFWVLALEYDDYKFKGCVLVSNKRRGEKTSKCFYYNLHGLHFFLFFSLILNPDPDLLNMIICLQEEKAFSYVSSLKILKASELGKTFGSRITYLCMYVSSDYK
jgi:hypothetical protein